MKALSFLIALQLCLALPLYADSADNALDRKALKDRNRQYQSREALRQKQEIITDFTEMDRKAAEERRLQLERKNYLIRHFEEVALKEITQARRIYDTATIQILEDEAFLQYHKDPNKLIYVYGLIYIYLFRCDYELYLYNTTKLMYERPRIQKKRAAYAERGLLLVEKLLATSPDDAEMWRIKGIFLSCLREKLFSKKHHFIEAEKTLKRAIQLSKDPTLAKLTLASFYLNQPKKQGQNMEAAGLISKEIIAKNPNLADAHLILGRVLQDDYKYQNAFDEFKKALALEPDNPEALYYYQIAKKDKKRFKKTMDF